MMVQPAHVSVPEMQAVRPQVDEDFLEQRKSASESTPDGSSGASSVSEDSGSSDETSTSDDLSDNETLASRHKSLKRTSTGEDHHGQRRRSSSDSGSKPSSSKKRRNLFPVIRKSQRCGKCHTCLNPQLKKACLTVREQMMREARQGSNSTSQPVSRKAASQQSSRADTAPASLDRYTDLLVPYINNAGGVSDVAKVQPFVKALSSFSSTLARTLPCTILSLSSQPVLAEFMNSGGVDVLSGWMLQAMEEDTDQASQFLVEALSTLKKLPVTKTFVQSTRSAKIIGALRKHDGSNVAKLAREVVAIWMKAIPPTAKSTSSKPATAAAATPSAGEQRPGAARSAGPTALPAAKRIKTGQEPSTPGAAASTPLNHPTASKPSAGAGGIHVVSDNDLFKVAAKPKIPARLQGLNKQQQRKVQTLEPTEASMLLSGRPAAQTEQQDQEPHLQLQIQVDEDQQSLSVALKLTQQPTATSVSDNKPAGAAAAKGPSTSSVSRLPGRRLGFGTGLGNNKPAAAGAGDNSISALLGGAWAQGSAAAGVTELVEKPKKKGPAKRVMWRPDRDLVAVRWFVKDDAPAKACKDAHLSDEQLRALATNPHRHHPAFDQAARMEHQRERQLIEQQHKEAQEAAARMRAEIDAMQPTSDWYGTPPAVALDPTWQVASGEDSTEAKQQVMPVDQLLAALAAVNPQAEPLESFQLLQPPNALFNVPYHDRNVKIVPLHTTVQAAASQQPTTSTVPQPTQQQQQQFMPEGGQLVLAQPQQQQGMQMSVPGALQQPSQQPQQQDVLQLQQLPVQGSQSGQLVLQPIAHQQQQQQQQPFPGPSVSSGPVSGGDQQQQLMQALQSLSQGGLLQALQAGGQPQQQQQQLSVPLPPQQLQQQPQIPGMQVPQQLPPASAPQVVSIPGGGTPMQVMMPDGRIATIVAQGQPGQPVQLPPGIVLLPQQQQPSQPMVHVQQPPGHGPPQYVASAGPLGSALHEQHRLDYVDDHDHEWGGRGGHGKGSYGRGDAGRGARGRGGRGRHGRGDGVSQPWGRIKRECKFFTTPRGCQKGDQCQFMHILSGEKFDVRDERRTQG